MVQLPIELWREVCRFLCSDETPVSNLHSLGNLRQTCSLLDAAASELMFRDLVLGMDLKSLASIREVTKSPFLVSLVKTLTIEFDHCPLLTPDQFQQTYKHRAQCMRPRRSAPDDEHIERADRELDDEQFLEYFANCSMEDSVAYYSNIDFWCWANEKPNRRALDLAYRHYQTQAQEVKTMIESSLREALCRLLLACPRLQTIRVVNGLITRDYEETMSRFRLGLLSPADQTEVIMNGHLVLDQFVLAAQDAQKSFAQFDLEMVSEKLLCLDVELPVFKDATKITWLVPRITLQDEYDRSMRVRGMSGLGDWTNQKLRRIFLQSSDTLRYLDLVFSDETVYWFEGLSNLGLLFKDIKFVHLQTFIISKVQASAADIEDFLLRHMDSLQTVFLHHIFLTGPVPHDYETYLSRKIQLLEEVFVGPAYPSRLGPRLMLTDRDPEVYFLMAWSADWKFPIEDQRYTGPMCWKPHTDVEEFWWRRRSLA